MSIPDVMGVAEIAARLGVSRSRADQLTRERGMPDGLKLTMGWVWSTEDVEAWIARRWPDKVRTDD